MAEQKPEALPGPEILERNSEQKYTVMFIIGVVAAVLGAAIDKLLGTDVLSDWPTTAKFLGGLATVFGMLWTYVSQRAPKHNSMANEVQAQANLLMAKVAAANPPSDPGQQ